MITMNEMANHKTGFTIVELIIVLVVIGILAALVIVGYSTVQQKARDTTVLSDLEGLDSIETRYGQHNNTSGKSWSSVNGIDSSLNFTPNPGNVIVVTIDSADYCIRGYNPSAATYNSLANAAIRESTAGACGHL